ncbi:unnamed protein product [Kuraishia capsulata CBS 1993]|uniref:Proteasome alpha-type subunits domain-containing protein n=1 Tax=Kuraishia capsulata CBS 1993 TaxID=1382522 RepID=W6MNE2_9ASCO|nr:uncharacterized protein KUCA_T00002514001 [Kuraishia capsulata CBS 1993]CDK26542.1 unnamed protein product [Kuraishia capsulata CBS 1993]
MADCLSLASRHIKEQIIFSPDGRNFQVEYASKAVENAGTSVGIKCKDGIVLAVEKILTSKLHVKENYERSLTIDRHIGVVWSGLIPDGRHLVNRGRDEAQSYKSLYKDPITVPGLVDRLGYYVQNYTCYNSVRPFGINAIIGGKDASGFHLYMIEPSGTYWGYRAIAAGKGRQIAKSELEKLDFDDLDVETGLIEAAKIIHLAHEDNKDRDYETDLLVCDASGYFHKPSAEQLAKVYEALDNLSEGDSDDNEMEE